MNFRRFPYAQHFLRDNRGNVLPIFALSLLPVLALVGMGIDYGRSSAANAKLQTAVDSTALAMATNAASLSASDLAAQANAYFLAVLSGAGVVNPTITTSYSNTNGSQLVVNGSATVNTYFLGLPPISKSAVNISSSSTIAWGSSRLRVALVLDNTGSMAQSGKMGALQTATKNLLSQLKTAAVNNGDVYVSIIPFVKDINVGSTNYNGNWIDWTDWDANHGTCGSSGGGGNGNNGNGNGNGNNGNGNGNNGNGNGNNGNGNNGGGGGGSSKSSCNGTWTPAAHSTWNGCITDRTQSYDTNVTAPTSGTVATLFPSEQYGSCPLQLKGLSYDWTSMNNLVNQMTPNGNTNQAIGLAWGWLSLVGGGPLTAPAMDSNYQYNQVIILLTDGLNTQDRWYSDQASIDARQQITCNNIKAAGITLYTVQVNTGGDPTSTLLQNCASDSSKFFLLKSSGEIVTTFNAIGTNLSKLRIAK